MVEGDGLRVLGLVPARGGSKGIPGKNRRLLGGKPLLEWTAEAAHRARRLARVVLSTEDEGIAEIGRSVGLEVPFRRPSELARDETPMLPVIVHALETLEQEGARFDAVCILQPTSPLRTGTEIDRAVERLERGDVDTVLSVLPVPHEHNPHWVFFEDAGRLRLATGEETPIARRQELPSAYHRDGSLYLVQRSVVLGADGRPPTLFGRRIAGITSDPARYVNLDTPDDWARAERLIAAEEEP